MKILVISKAYVVALNQSKLEKLSKFKDLSIILIVPEYWRTKEKTIYLEKKKSRGYKIIPARTVFNGKINFYFYISKLISCIKKFKPDIIHIEEEPWCLTALQVILLKNIYSPKSKIILFTWENIYRKFPFPFSFLERYILSNVDFMIAGNKEATEILISKKKFKKEVKVLPQFGVNLSSFRKLNVDELKKKLNLNGFVIGFVGRLVKEKGIHLLVEAISKIESNCKLLLVGRGNYKKEILKLVEKTGIQDKVLIIEDASHSDVPEYINCMDVLVLPSITTTKWKEQFGHVLIEAMACGVSVIGSDSGEIPNVINKTGLIFKENETNDLKKKLEFLMNNNNLRKSLSKQGLDYVYKKYDNHKIALSTYKLYKNLLRK